MTKADGASPESLEGSGLLLEALESYEDSFRRHRLTQQSVINLAFLYGQCWDYGFADAHRIPNQVAQRTAQTFQSFIDEARRQFGDWDDLRVVEVYLPWAFLGVGETPTIQEEMQVILQRGQSLLPVLFLWKSQEPERFSPERNQLLSLVSAEATSKARYIRSVLKA